MQRFPLSLSSKQYNIATICITHCVRYYKSSGGGIKYAGNIHRLYVNILYKGLEHPQILLSKRVLEPVLHRCYNSERGVVPMEKVL